ncbi:MAG: serine hydrolase domain-containing protein [Nocardioides sp.]
MPELRPATTRALRRIALDRQVEGRVPGLFAGVVRDGGLVWSEGVGAADISRPDSAPGPDDQFLVASNSKTFTAVLIMQLRDEGRLRLDDTLDVFLPGTRHGHVTLRACLAHVSGLQREPVGDVWATLESPDRDDLVAGLEQAEAVGRQHHLWHYSNLVYSLLGEVVARVDGREWYDALKARLLDPLGMTRTTRGFDGGPRVTGYFVPPWTDVPVQEPEWDVKALDACTGLASTPADMARWSGFVAAPPSEVLDPDTLDEMCEPRTMVDRQRWTLGFGLGFMVARHGTRLYVGHTGAMPGHITGLFTHRESGTGGLAFMNTTSAPDPAAFAVELADHVVEHDPVEPPVWRPGTEVPSELAGLLGVWFSEGTPFVFSVRQGRLEARMQGLAEHKPSSVFERVEDDVYRTVQGRETGELLRITRDEHGGVRHLHWATYLCTRAPLAFGEQPPAR